MDQNHVLGLQMAEQLHDSFRICMGRETHIVDLHLDMNHFIIDGDFLLTAKDFVADGARHAVAWDDHGVFLTASPLFKCLQTKATMKHTWRGKEDHGSVRFKRALIELAYVRKVEHILLNESLFDFLICPIDEQLVVEVGLLRQPT